MRESDFIRELRALVGRPVHGLDERRKAEIVQRLSAQMASTDGEAPPEVEWVPFVTGRRPIDEASFPGLGSSDRVALIVDDVPAGENTAYLLYRLNGLSRRAQELDRYRLELSLSIAGPWGDANSDPLPQWTRRVVAPLTFELDDHGLARLKEMRLADAGDRCLAVALSPATDFAGVPLGFENLFVQQVRAEMVLLRDDVPVSASQTMIDLCDGRVVGSFYRRIVDRLIAGDAEAQGRRHGLPSLDRAYHPWFPALLIGGDKADLYMRALIEDIVRKKRHLTDPGWLLRVGIYLELITTLGIHEAVNGELLSNEERVVYETSAAFAPIRNAVNAEAWKKVWKLREIAMAPAAEVSAMNLLAKKKATLAFLEAHHEDLKHAIRLAGPNEHNAQETWHRVFRDAERAVLRKTPAAFPELAMLPAKAQEFILWHQMGKIRGLSLPAVSSWFGDQDGLYASACNQYRASMNHVGEWAKGEGLMDFAGSECIPEPVSVLKALMDGKHVRLAQLQRRDGYFDAVDLTKDVPKSWVATREAVVTLFRDVPIFRVLTDDEIEKLAATARPIELGPVERIIVEGRHGTSLFIVAEGDLEVMVRQKDGVDLPVAILEPGSVFGEMSLLTGQRRSATVRSIDSAVVYEVGHQQLGPILSERPDAVNQLAAIMEPRLRATAGAKRGYEAKKEIVSLGRKIRSFLLSSRG